jgi:TPP-dependent pyruvate/acetoin dehydrogenase alpha subunit
MDSKYLIDFELEIKELFLNKKILCPIHLAGGNEQQLIDIFKYVKKDDWVFSNHRSHLHALLKGVPRELVRQEILNKNSMHLNFKDYNFTTTSIVGGCLPIALGVALGIKLNNKKNHVWIFVGDMAAEMGVFHECTKYAGRNDLPITFIIEDNGLSTDTPTQEAWGLSSNGPDVIRYKYDRTFPHTGVGQFVSF